MKDIKYLGAIGYSVRKDRQLTNYCEQSVKLYVLVRKWKSKEIITIGPSFHCCLNTAAEEIPKESNHWFVYNVFRKKYRPINMTSRQVRNFRKWKKTSLEKFRLSRKENGRDWEIVSLFTPHNMGSFLNCCVLTVLG